MKPNTKKATVVSDGKGRTLWTGALRPGRMHEQTALKTEGISDQFEQQPKVKTEVDSRYQGLAKQFPDQVQTPPKNPKKDAPTEEVAAWEQARKQQSSERICVEHANAEHNNGAPSAAATTTTRPTWQSPDWSPTAQPSGDHPPANPPGQHDLIRAPRREPVFGRAR
jgi:hypothetical protein